MTVDKSLTLNPLLLSEAPERSVAINHSNVPISIYDIRTNRRRVLILIMLAFSGLILPFCDTVYLPALAQLEHDLKASTTLVDYTISAYLITAGVSGLLWGPLSDRFGRKMILLISFAVFIAFTIVCTLARTIVVLLIFRSLQGGAISASLVVGQSVIVDIYPPERLGFAMGLFLVPLLVGPIAGPFVGGALSSWFGWRSTFITLAIMAVISMLIILIFVPETHHYFVTNHLSTSLFNIGGKKKKKLDRIIVREADSITKPHFVPPWRPLVFLFDMKIVPHVVACAVNFAALFVAFTLLSNRTAQEPYSLSPLHIGICYIPTGTLSLLGSLLGGFVSDWSAKRFPRVLEGRLIFSLLGSLLCPIGLLICGWIFHFGAHLAGAIIGACVFCFGEAFLYTSVCAFVNVKRPAMAGTILSLITALSFVYGGVGIMIAIPLLALIKYGPLFSLLAGLSFAALSSAIMVVVYEVRKSRCVVAAPDSLKHQSPPAMLNGETRKKSIPMQWF